MADLTSNSKLDQKPDSSDHKNNIQNEMLVVVNADAIVHPRTVTIRNH